VQIADVPHVEQVKVTVGKRDPLAGSPPLVSALAKFAPAQDFVFCAQWGRVAGGDCSMACNNSARETVAVPRFITTIPPA